MVGGNLLIDPIGFIPLFNPVGGIVFRECCLGIFNGLLLKPTSVGP